MALFWVISHGMTHITVVVVKISGQYHVLKYATSFNHKLC